MSNLRANIHFYRKSQCSKLVEHRKSQCPKLVGRRKSQHPKAAEHKESQHPKPMRPPAQAAHPELAALQRAAGGIRELTPPAAGVEQRTNANSHKIHRNQRQSVIEYRYGHKKEGIGYNKKA